MLPLFEIRTTLLPGEMSRLFANFTRRIVFDYVRFPNSGA